MHKSECNQFHLRNISNHFGESSGHEQFSAQYQSLSTTFFLENTLPHSWVRRAPRSSMFLGTPHFFRACDRPKTFNGRANNQDPANDRLLRERKAGHGPHVPRDSERHRHQRVFLRRSLRLRGEREHDQSGDRDALHQKQGDR